MSISFNDLSQYLPSGSIELISGKIRINASILVGDNSLVSLDDSVIAFTSKLLSALTKLTDETNKKRVSASRAPIEFVEQYITAGGDSEALEAQSKFICKFKVDNNSFVNNVVDPT
ncbi:hypothetical protein NIES2101_23980 [Calothrix sp. HK-06]|nr:hypothetical protein NIES2101_23845 [Calothrix sp. HK-06]OKH47327.1 hypothetical protein NIES2101_23980 [Calothrix sp. HK-06]